MSRICGNCGTEMEQNGDNHYCPKCDETYAIKKGKQFVSDRPNAITQLKDAVKTLNDRIEKVEKNQEADDSLCGF